MGNFMFCKSCGRELKRQTTYCPYCGRLTRSQTSYTYTLDEETEQTNKVDKKDKFVISKFGLFSLIVGAIGVGFGIVGMFKLIPFVIFAGLASLIGLVLSFFGFRETLKLYRSGVLLAYIGSFVSIAGLFLTAASLIIKLTS